MSNADTSKEALERILADLRAPIRVQEHEKPNHVLRRANISRLDAAKAIAAVTAEREALTAEVARLTAALEFYGDEAAWNQPPVETVQTILGPAYRSAASKMQMDRGKIARDAIAAHAARRKGGAE